MKKFFFALSAALLTLTACGPGLSTTSTSYTKSTTSTPASTKAPKSQEAYLAFTSDAVSSIVVTIDGKEYKKETLKVTTTANMKELTSMASNIMTLTPGTHDVTVTKDGKQVYKQKITVSAQERKVVKL